jgi:hypothetical protein
LQSSSYSESHEARKEVRFSSNPYSPTHHGANSEKSTDYPLNVTAVDASEAITMLMANSSSDNNSVASTTGLADLDNSKSRVSEVGPIETDLGAFSFDFDENQKEKHKKDRKKPSRSRHISSRGSAERLMRAANDFDFAEPDNYPDDENRSAHSRGKQRALPCY